MLGTPPPVGGVTPGDTGEPLTPGTAWEEAAAERLLKGLLAQLDQNCGN